MWAINFLLSRRVIAYQHCVGGASRAGVHIGSELRAIWLECAECGSTKKAENAICHPVFIFIFIFLFFFYEIPIPDWLIEIMSIEGSALFTFVHGRTGLPLNSEQLGNMTEKVY